MPISNPTSVAAGPAHPLARSRITDVDPVVRDRTLSSEELTKRGYEAAFSTPRGKELTQAARDSFTGRGAPTYWSAADPAKGELHIYLTEPESRKVATVVAGLNGMFVNGQKVSGSASPTGSIPEGIAPARGRPSGSIHEGIAPAGSAATESIYEGIAPARGGASGSIHEGIAPARGGAAGSIPEGIAPATVGASRPMSLLEVRLGNQGRLPSG